MLQRAMALAAGDVHVWQASLAGEPAPDQLAALSAEECQRAGRMGNPRRRSTLLISRAVVRGVLAHELGQPAAALRFAIGPHGKPFVDPPSGVHFNVSHSGDIVVVAVSANGEVGVDVERIKTSIDHAALARRFFSPFENRQLASLPPPLRVDGFFTAWTRKEALLKAWGVGLSLPLDAFDVSADPRRPAQLLEVRNGPGQGGHWSVHDLQPGPGYSGAVAVEGSFQSLSCRPWRL